jgi:hypothetical protein
LLRFRALWPIVALFRISVLGSVPACRQPVSVSAWRLPALLWLLWLPLQLPLCEVLCELLPGQNPNLFFFQRAFFNPAGVPGTATGFGVTNPAYVAYPTNPSVVGNLGRNTFRPGRFRNTDLALVKSTKTFSENQSLQLRLEVFNVFNHISRIQTPYNFIGSSTDAFRFLNLGQTDGSIARTLMLTARYFFQSADIGRSGRF